MWIYNGLSVQNRRKTNMDSVLLKERRIAGEDVLLAAVCDGVGSMRDGAFASTQCVQQLSAWFDRLEDTRRLGLRLQEQIGEINRAVVYDARRRNLQTASTLSAVLVDAQRYYIVHLGDSRVYACRNGILTLLTRDQVQDGKLAACLGRWEEVAPFYNEGRLMGETFLLCSDGLYKRCGERELCAQLEQITRKNMNRTMKRMLQYAVEQGEQDNISLAVLLYEE